MKRLASWNVNGLRACIKKGFYKWLENIEAEVICIQETKANEDQVDIERAKELGYKVLWASADKKGYSGVATFYKNNPKEIFIGLGIEEFDCEGRTIITIFDDFILFNCYFPNGQRDLGRVPYKLKFSEAVAKRALELEQKYGLPSLICGDYNTAHQEIDLKNWKANQKTTGFLPIEREWMDSFISKGFVDLFRYHYPDKPEEYTWWTYRGDCRARNIGWRIDYFFSCETLASKTIDCYHQPNVMGSDHCPVILELK